MHKNPYEGLSPSQVYDGLISGAFGPRWPSEQLQAGYTGTNKIDLVRRAFSFADMLAADGAFKPGWKGLDYGCGWGRFLSILLSRGAPSQLDGCDAWPRTLAIISELGYENRIFRVSELIKDGEIAREAYDFILSFSVFTHLSPRSFENNIPRLLDALKPGGNLYITVRHDEFIDHKYKERGDELRAILKRDGVVFLDSGGDLTGEKLFGDTVIDAGYLNRFGKARYLGLPHSLQHVYALSR